MWKAMSDAINTLVNLSKELHQLKTTQDSVRKLHSTKDYSDITNKTYCKECQYEYPCDTLQIIGIIDEE